MKKLIITFLLMLVTITVSAQYVFTTEGKAVYEYSNLTGEFESVGYDSKYASRFVISDNQKIITHTISTMESNYYVENSSSEVLNDGTQILRYQVTSDVGNKYEMVFSKFNVMIFNYNATPAYCLGFIVKKIFK